jgi:hypothetical protein
VSSGAQRYYDHANHGQHLAKDTVKAACAMMKANLVNLNKGFSSLDESKKGVAVLLFLQSVTLEFTVQLLSKAIYD